MYEGYFALGGQEIINNERARGYAETADCPLTWFTGPECEGLYQAVGETVYGPWEEGPANLATNPSFETASGTVEMRRNLITNPSFEANTTDWSGAGTSAPTPARVTTEAFSGSASMQIACNGSAAEQGTWTPSGIPAGVGETYTASVYVKGTAGRVMRLRLRARDGVGFPGSVTSDFTLTGGWDRLSVTYPSTPATTIALDLAIFNLAAVAHTFYVDAVMIELGNALLPYFDGGVSPQLRTNWIRAPRSSGPTQSNYANTANTSVSDPAGSGETVSHLVTTGTNGGRTQGVSNDSGAAIDLPAGPATFTVRALVPQGAMWRPVVQEYSKAVALRGEGYGDWRPGTGAWEDALAPYTVLFSDSRTRAGAQIQNAGEFWLWGASAEVGNVDGGYFDGTSTAPPGFGYAWLGTADASPSYMYDADFIPTWAGTANNAASVLNGVPITGFTPSNCRLIRSSRWSLSGDYSARLIVTAPNPFAQTALNYIPESARAQGVTFVTAHTEKVNVGRPMLRAQLPTQDALMPAAAPPGDYPLRVPYADLTDNYRVQLRVASAATGDEVWFDLWGLFAGGYEGSWFSGDTPNTDTATYAWAGASNDSVTTSETRTRTDPEPYSHSGIAQAPWYDLANDELSRRFFGAYAVSVDSLLDSTRQAAMIENILDGGTMGRVRKASRSIRMRVLLTARGRDALDYGLAWLSAQLDPGACGQHGEACGTADLAFLADCPPLPGLLDPEQYRQLVLRRSRYLHGVGALSGPIITDTYKSKTDDFWGYMVEFIWGAQSPYVYSVTIPVPITFAASSVIQDVPYNLVPYPSAELGSGSVVVARNLATNPSLESNTTGWTHTSSGVTAGNVSSDRSNVIAAVGTWSFRPRFVATNSGTNGTISGQHEVAISPATTATSRISLNMWAFAEVETPPATMGPLVISAIWRTGSTVLRTDSLGTMSINGGALSLKSVNPPVGANNVLMRATANIQSWSTGTIVNLYADAVAVTVP